MSASGEAEARLPDLRNCTVAELLRLSAQAIEELRRRGVLRTRNQPVGDYAEYLCAKAFGWRLTRSSTASCDAVDGAGLRYQIKARRLAGGAGDRQLGVIRNLDAGGFEFLAVVLFDELFGIRRAAAVPLHAVRRRAEYSVHQRGWILHADDVLLTDPESVDITSRLRDAALS